MRFSLFRSSPSAPEPVVVKFAGGMGTQILQASTLFCLGMEGAQVYADISYFERPFQPAQEGDKGVATHWHWQLDHYGLHLDSFNTKRAGSKDKARVISDGAEMMKLGITGLDLPTIREKFSCPTERPRLLESFGDEGYISLHIRRGDYVNVASHLMREEEFLDIAKKFSGMVSNAVVLSDSLIAQEVKRSIQNFYPRSIFLDKTDPVESHVIMRKSKILICSNSTFSLTAGLLNENGLVIVPRKWFGDQDSVIEKSIHNRANFEIIN